MSPFQTYISYNLVNINQARSTCLCQRARILITFLRRPSSEHPDSPASPPQSNTLQRFPTSSQLNIAFPSDAFTSLCTSHIHLCNANPEEQSGGYARTIASKCSAHSAHGYVRVSAEIKSLASFSCLLVGSSGYCAANVCKNIHVARPNSSLEVFPSVVDVDRFASTRSRSRTSPTRALEIARPSTSDALAFGFVRMNERKENHEGDRAFAWALASDIARAWCASSCGAHFSFTARTMEDES